MKYTDPDGREINDVDTELVMSSALENSKLGDHLSTEYINEVGCTLTAYTRIANAIGNKDFSLEKANKVALENNLFTSGNLLTPENGAELINALLSGTGKSVSYAGSITAKTMTEYASFLNSLENSYSQLYVTARINTFDAKGENNYNHTVNINSNTVIAGDIQNVSNALNIKINDTSGVRTQIMNDIRKNTLLRIDYFRVN